MEILAMERRVFSPCFDCTLNVIRIELDAIAKLQEEPL